MRVVRSFSTEQKESQTFKDSTLKTYDIGKKIAMLGSSFMSIGILLGYGVVLAILYYGGTLVIKGELTVGDLSSFVLYTLTMTCNYKFNVVSLLAVSGTMNNMISAAAVSEKIFSLMDYPIKV
jgi:ATP-binding cassette subfamily B protein